MRAYMQLFLYNNIGSDFVVINSLGKFFENFFFGHFKMSIFFFLKKLS